MTLALQDYLRSGHRSDDLTNELGISVYRHPTLPLAGFKYGIESPRFDPVVRDCRGTVLEDGSWEVVAKPFRRFYNPGETPEEFGRFDWSDFTCTSKEDGSLIIVYHYKGSWHVNTSGSFGLDKCTFSGRSWRDLFWEVSGIDRVHLERNLTYVFEMCTPYNKIIRVYPEPTVFLLSMFDVRTLEEFTVRSGDVEARHIGVRRPEHHQLGSMDDITAFLREVEARDQTYEGVVIRDRHNERFKIKTATYLRLHTIYDNGNIFNPKRLVPIILAGEADELVAYLPETKPHLDRIRNELDRHFDELATVWREIWQIENQKEFAIAVLTRTPFSGVLFALRKTHGMNQDERALRDVWNQSGDQILRRIYA